MVYCGSLENCCAERYRGFESYSLRNFIFFIALLPIFLFSQNAFAGDLAVQPFSKAGDDSVLSKKLNFQSVLSRKPLTRAFMENEVTLEDGQTMKLGRVLGKAFEEQDKFAQGASRIASRGGVLKGPVEVQDEVLEFEDSYAIVKSTSVTVTNPQVLAGASPEFGSFLAGGRSRFNKALLKPEGVAGLQNFMRHEMASLPADDPIRQAAEAGGEDAVIQAIADGKGPFEIVDTVVVPKRAFLLSNGRLQMPTLRNGVFSYSALQPFQAAKNAFRPILLRLDLPDLATEAVIPPHSPVATSYEAAESRSSGEFEYKTQFLTGFTRGDSWEWERRWNYCSGFFRITLMGSYGIGMRIPIEVSGELHPTNIFIKDIQDHPTKVHHSVGARALNADAKFYRDAGLSNDLIFDGNEGVLQVRFGWGCRFRVFWTNVYHNPNSWDLDFDHNVNFSPPFGSDTDAFDIVIPASLTNTSFDLGVLEGSAEAGIHVSGKGNVTLEYNAFEGSQKIRSEKVRFNDRNMKNLEFTLPALQTEGRSAQKKYGFSWSKPEYHAQFFVTPEVRVNTRVGYGDFSRRFNTGWIRLNEMRINLGGVTFDRHRGTRSEFKYNDGEKKFKKIDAASQAEVTPFISDLSGKYVRAGVGPGSFVAAASPHARSWEKFQFFGSDGGSIVSIRSFQSGKYLAPVGPGAILTASEDSIGTITQFEIEYYPDGTFSLFSIRLQAYVRAGVGANGESYLAAVSPHVRGWERFRFTPKPAPAPARTAPPSSTEPTRSQPSRAPRPGVVYTKPSIKAIDFNLTPQTTLKPLTKKVTTKSSTEK